MHPQEPRCGATIRVSVLNLLIGAIPLLLSGVIYLVARPHPPAIIHRVRKELNETACINLPIAFTSQQWHNWLVFNLPDMLWALSFSFMVVHALRDYTSEARRYLLLLAFSIALALETAQLSKPMGGTFDLADILSIGVGFAAGWFGAYVRGV